MTNFGFKLLLLASIAIGCAGFTSYQAEAGLLDAFIQTPKERDVIGTIGKVRNDKLSDSFSVLVWNTQKFGNEGFWQDLEMLAKQKELVLVQEAMFDLKSQSSMAITTPQLSWTTATSFYSPTQDFAGTGVTTGTTAKTTDRAYLKTMVKEPVVGTPKVALFTKHPIGEKELMVVNIHAINFVSIFKFRLEMRRLFSRIKKHDGPLLVAGDFNTWAPVRMDIVNNWIEKLELEPIAFPDGARSTGLGRVLDHAFIRGLKVIKSYDFSWITSSDHKPLVFDLQAL